MTMSQKFVVESASNGGVIVSALNDRPGYMPDMLGAFTTPADMITWLAEQYDVRCTVTVDAVAPLMGERAGESVVTPPTGGTSGRPPAPRR